MSLFVLGDTGVVFSESAQEIYQLNTTATFIWFQFEDGLCRSEAARELSQTFGLSQKDAERHVQEAILGWERHGVLAGSERVRPSKQEPITSLEARPAQSEGIVARGLDIGHCYCVFGHCYQVHYGSTEIEDMVHPILSHLESRTGGGGEPTTRIVAVPDEGGFIVAQSDGPNHRCRRLEEIAPLVKVAIFADAVKRSRQAIAIHAGAVSLGDRAMILPGPAGSGKSTLTAALVHAGLDYLTDDLVLLDTQHHTIRGVPFGLTIKDGGESILSGRYPALGRLPQHVRADGKRVRYLPLAQSDSGQESETAPRINWLVLPTYLAAGNNRLSPLPHGEALVRLTRSCTMMRPVTPQEVGGLVSLLEETACFEIEVSSLDQAIEQLLGLWQDGP